jgi:lipid-A-disaccharide synthase
VTPVPRPILIIAGEASGDLYGGLLMRALTRIAAGAAPGGPLRFLGVGGPAMRAAGLEAVGDADVMGVTGLIEVVSRLRSIRRAFRGAAAALGNPDGRPSLALLIDYPDFNLRLACQARRARVPVLYFVSPQVWAWRKGRVRQIARRVDKMLVILPFEEEIYRRAGIPVEFVGHPLLDLVRAERGREATLRPLGLDPRRPTVALLPGSRENEIDAHLPAMLGACRLLHEEFRDLQFVMPLAPTLPRQAVERRLVGEGGAGRTVRDSTNGAPWRPVLVEQDRYDALAASDAAVVASGTATLETALLGVPMVIVYRMNPITYGLARLVSDVTHIGMPNLIMGERIVPELVQRACRPATIAGELRRLLTDRTAAETMRRDLGGVRLRLGAAGAIDRAAGVAWDMIAALGAPGDGLGTGGLQRMGERAGRR